MGDSPVIHIRAYGDFAPSDRLRVALERVAAAYGAEGGSSPSVEVEGFASRLQIGNLDLVTVDRKTGVNWNDGCWGYDSESGSCGWHQHDGDSCVFKSRVKS